LVSEKAGHKQQKSAKHINGIKQRPFQNSVEGGLTNSKSTKNLRSSFGSKPETTSPLFHIDNSKQLRTISEEQNNNLSQNQALHGSDLLFR
jgi:hypothetical protein